MAYKIVNDDSLTSVANAIRVQGSISGTLEFPDGFVSAIQNLSPSPTLQTKTYTVDSAGTETITADSGYDGLSSVEVSVPSADPYVTMEYGYYTENNVRKWKAEPRAEVMVSEGDTAGWVADGFQKIGEEEAFSVIPTGTTVTPTESAQTVGGFNHMMEGAVTINPIPSNYKDTTDATATADKILSGYTAYANGQKLTGTASGGITPSGTMSITSNGIYNIVSFASVDVNVSGGGGGDHDAEDGIIMRTISGAYENSRVTSIGNSAFYNCASLTTANFPNVTFIGNSAFYSCTSLTTANFPNVTMIWSSAFRNCIRLESFYVLASSVATLGTAVFASTPMSLSNYLGHFGSIYVPASLVDTYKSARNWSAYASRITAYEG